MSRRILLLAAIVCGIAASVLSVLFLRTREAEVQELKTAINQKYGTLEALCFREDTPEGTALQRSDLGLRTVPRLGLRGQALTMDNLDDILGRKTLLGHRKGDIVFWSDIEGGNPADSGLSASIKRHMRAMSINCVGAASVSGRVKPNDHVDVIGTFSFLHPDGTLKEGDVVTCTILQNVLVLAIEKSTVTLEVTPREAEMLAFTEQMKGRLTLTLRGRSDMSYERELPSVDFNRIKSSIETLNLQRQQQNAAH